MANTDKLALPLLSASQAQKHVTHNEALRLLDGIVQLSVLDRDLTAPPSSPANGNRYIVASGATGAWAGWDLDIAFWTNGAWLRLSRQTGWRAWVEDEGLLLIYNGTAWVDNTPDDLNVQTLGINASADTTNRLAVSAAATLLNNAGAGHQLKINKATASDTASLLFQTGFSGRAEMGTAGSDDFSVKVSADGSNWNTALTANAGTGAVTLGTPLGVASGGTGGATATAARTNLGLGTSATLDATSSETDTTLGRVLRVGDFGIRSPLNIMPDSGTFRGIRRNTLNNTDTFSPGQFFNTYNGSTFANGGDFIHDNSTFGGTNGALNSAMQDLLSAMGRSGGNARYGTTFSILQITAGSGTARSSVGPDTVTRYLVSNISTVPSTTSWNDRQTLVMWARVVSGSAHTNGLKVFINEVDQGSSALIPSTWSRIVTHQSTYGYGYDVMNWRLYAQPGSVIELACVGIFFDLVQPMFWRTPLMSVTSQFHIIGTVSQSGGAPTGALMEQGSNANGRYIRYADGTQICTHTISTGLEIGFGFMGGFRCFTQTWTYPAAFTAAPQLSVTPMNLTAFAGISGDNPGTSSAKWSVTAVASQSSSTRKVDLLAVGRWF